MTQVWTKEKMQYAIEHKYCRFTFHKVIKVIYDRQTQDEQANCGTRHENSMGFNGADAPYLTDVYQKSKRFANGVLSEAQFARCKKMMKKYWRQLCEVKNGELDTLDRAQMEADELLPCQLPLVG
jgi:hypothetical protein